MLANQKGVESFLTNIASIVDSTKYVLGFNEPEIPGQANMGVSEAVGIWKEHLEPLADKGITLISPAVTSDANGIPWLEQFIQECGGCRIGKLAFHFYGTKASDFITYIEGVHKKFPGYPIWVTEVGCQSFTDAPQASPSEVVTFLKEITAYMDTAPFIEQYFYFMVSTPEQMAGVNPANALMDSDGQPSALGKIYIKK
jgi:hypothetical protein